jgi:hypothetical protein
MISDVVYLSKYKVTPLHSLQFRGKYPYITCFNFVHDFKVTPHFSGDEFTFYVCMTEVDRVKITNDTFTLRQLCKKKDEG